MAEFKTVLNKDTGELKKVEIGSQQQSSSSNDNRITDEDLQKLEQMSKLELISLIKRVSGAIWGIGMIDQPQREDAMLLKLSILALTSIEAKDVVSTSKEYFDRMRGKPAQSIDLHQKIGIVQIVMEAAKLRKEQSLPFIENSQDGA